MIKQFISNLIRYEYTTVGEFEQAMIKYRVEYSKSAVYSAVGNMNVISKVGAAQPGVIQNDVCTAEQLVELYNRGNPNDMDDSNNVQYPVLRHAGVVALNNLIKPYNIQYMYNRVRSECMKTKGTTSNEALRIFNGRLSAFGGIRTFTTAQQCIIVIIYQNNKSNNQYHCEIKPLSLHRARIEYTNPLPAGADPILRGLQAEFHSYTTEWTDTELTTLQDRSKQLAIGKGYYRTRNVYQFIQYPRSNLYKI